MSEKRLLAILGFLLALIGGILVLAGVLNLPRSGNLDLSGIAERAVELARELPIKPYIDIPRMAQVANQMLMGSIEAFKDRDPAVVALREPVREGRAEDASADNRDVPRVHVRPTEGARVYYACVATMRIPPEGISGAPRRCPSARIPGAPCTR